jgi:hypothetical protein
MQQNQQFQLPPEEEVSITLSGDWSGEMADRLSAAWFDTMSLTQKLPPEIRYMPGMSGRKYRSLINNLVSTTPDARYLEIGSWAGSTACSAIWGNTVTATCIDNWSEFGGPKDAFHTNVKYCLTDEIKFDFIESDFRAVDYSSIGKFNIYMFDGPHSEQDQYDGVVIAQPALDDHYCLIVDDWNAQQVREGTERAIKDLNLTVHARMDIFSNQNNNHPIICKESSDWHNGYLIAVVSKARA